MPRKSDEKVLYSVRDRDSEDYEFVTNIELIHMRRVYTLVPEKPRSDGKIYLYRYVRMPK